MKPEHQSKVHELIDTWASTLKIEAENLYRSGMVDVEAFDPDHYTLAKILVTAAIERRKNDYAPLDKANKDEVKNLLNA